MTIKTWRMQASEEEEVKNEQMGYWETQTSHWYSEMQSRGWTDVYQLSFFWSFKKII